VIDGAALAAKALAMNAIAMSVPKLTYALEIHQLARPYRSADSLQNATRLHSYESATPFGAFHTGDTLSQSQPTRYLGRIQHIHHSIGVDGAGNLHRTILYVFNEG
jgi:hypothetical protein